MSTDPESTDKKYMTRSASLRYVESKLRARVETGRWSPGAMLPSRRDLAREFGVDLHTIQRAIVPLLEDGTLRADGGRGTFVQQVVQRTSPFSTGGGSAGKVVPRSGQLVRQDALLGIVCATEIADQNDPDAEAVWSNIVLRALERSFSEAGGAVRYLDRRALNPRSVHGCSIAEAVETLRGEWVDAIVFIDVCAAPEAEDELITAGYELDVPLAIISWHGIAAGLPQVYYDSRNAGYQAAAHLIQRGYQRLLFLQVGEAEWMAQRYEGAREATRHSGLPESALTCVASYPGRGFYDVDGEIGIAAAGYAAVLRAQQEGLEPLEFADGSRPGLIAANDQVACGALRAAQEQSRLAGRDFGLIGFDDDRQSRILGLTSLRPPLEAMGAEAARLLVAAANGERLPLRVGLASHLVARASTRLPL